jgi:hypothetical protein
VYNYISSKMSSQQKPNERLYSVINCNRLVVYPTTTNLKWDPVKKAKDIIISGSLDVARSRVIGEESGVLGAQGFEIGVMEKAWYFEVYEPGFMYFGMALGSQKLDTTEGVALKHYTNTERWTLVRFSLTTGGLVSVTQENRGDKDNSITKIYDLTPYMGQTLYIWASTTVTDTMSIKLLEDVVFETTVDNDGSVRMSGKKVDIVDFNLSQIIENNDGGVPIGGTSASFISNALNDSKVQVENSGSITIRGGVSYSCENIGTGGPSITLTSKQFFVEISTPTITTINLPSTSTIGCQNFFIARKYPIQAGETWQAPVLNIVPTVGETICGDLSIGIPPMGIIQLFGDGVSTWRII